MQITVENFLLVGAILLIVCIVASKASLKMGLPTAVLFIGIGMLAGSDGIGGIYFDSPYIAKFLGLTSLSLILFSGGLETHYQNIRPVYKEGIVLSTLGVLITALAVGLFVHLISDRFTLAEGMLLGAIISSTDAAAVFSIFRSRRSGLKHNLRPLLEFESGSNDPMAYFLTISMIQLVQHPGESSVWVMVPLFIQGMVVGGVAGYLMGRAIAWVLNRIGLEIDSLYPLLTMGFVLLTYALTDAVGGNGFLAVYVAGLVIGNRYVIHKKSLARYFDGLSYLMQIVMFLTLGLLVFPSQLPGVFWIGLAVSLFLILVARPLAVMLCMAPFKSSFRDKLFVSWVGLRGAAPIIFATYPMVAGVGKATLIFNIVFFISLTSVLLQGSTLVTVARWFKLVVPDRIRRKSWLDLDEKDASVLEIIDIPPSAWGVGKPIMRLKLPESVMIVTVNHRGKYSIPNGSTVIHGGDQLYVISDRSDRIERAMKIIQQGSES